MGDPTGLPAQEVRVALRNQRVEDDHAFVIAGQELIDRGDGAADLDDGSASTQEVAGKDVPGRERSRVEILPGFLDRDGEKGFAS